MWTKKCIRSLLYILPLVLFFSFWPVIKLGGNESMNFELSLPLVWLVVSDGVGLLMLVQERKLFDWAHGRRWLWLLFPVWLSITVIWSLNVIRGVLTVGIMWLLYFAGYVIWTVRKTLDERFRVVWWKWFFGSTLLVCGWCVVQCILDLAGVGQDYSLMCDGCTYHMFGFPHPNGFAIEPQFMGNLLLAPTLVAVYLLLAGPGDMFRLGPRPSGPSPRADGANPRAAALRNAPSSEHIHHPLTMNKLLLFYLFTLTATLFLTFSRGAIYAFIVGMLFMSGFVVFSGRKRERGWLWKRVGMVWGLVILSFVVVLNVQGLMAEVGPTSDTYYDGVAKVVNHLSLGVIDLKGGQSDRFTSEEIENTEGELQEDEFVVVENSVENSEKEEAIFDGYVAESTDTRVRLSGGAVKVWSQNPLNALFGVGLGGAGYALYNNGLSPAPKEIVQNEYASLLLETGLIGVSLLALTLVLVMRAIWKNDLKVMVLGLLVAYGVSLVFFSGLPNALHIYLLPVVMIMMV